MIFKYQNFNITKNKVKTITRRCSNSSLQKDVFINKQLKIAAYQPKLIENKNVWNIRNIRSTSKEKFSMIFPPPNVTGNIHLGHALTATIQDVIIRWKRKQNFDTQWIFGTDHAGIATQLILEKILFKRENKTRHEIGREQFLKETWNWKNEKNSSIKNDLKRLGSTFNWEKEYFTMDQNLSEAVNEAFIRLFDKGLIYRENSLVNWCCSLESAISDVEIESLEVDGKTSISIPNYEKNITVGILTEFAYKIVDSDEEIVVSTTRPETMLADSAVAVNPNDPRYSHLNNIKLHHPYRNESIPLIFDESVDVNFGTGAVKITPAHDKNDFEVGKRHDLQFIQLITENGLIRDSFEGFSGLGRFDAREKILNSLVDLNLLRGSKSHKMILPICSRSKDIIEFMIKPQWFVKCNDLSKQAVEAVETGQLKINPQIFEKEWFRWLTNCRDWCISRQLWWGHQIPAYKFQQENEEIWIAAKSQEEAEKRFKKMHPDKNEYLITRDQDVLDTWFSSALLPFSVYNWPNIDANFNKYFPLNLMETGHDILFFWVARMVMLSLELTGKIPFKEVLLHGIVCDAHGRKMSKSLGNVILPEQIINGITLEELQNETLSSVEKGIISKSELEKSLDGQKKMFPNGIQECGVDALRFTLCSQNIKQHVINFDINDCITNKLFFNKIWQASKFAINYAETKNLKIYDMKNLKGIELSEIDFWILSRLGNTIETVSKSIENYNFHFATAALKTFFYNNFCDVYLETTKEHLKNDTSRGFTCAHVLNLCLSIGLSHMEIFTPYLAKELFNYLPIIENLETGRFINNELEKKIENLLDICASIREVKAHLGVTKKTDACLKILIKLKDHEDFFNKHLNHIRHLTFSNNVELLTNATDFEKENLTASSTASHMCSFGISIKNFEKQNNSNETLNRKKLLKLEQELTNLLNVVNKEGYKEKAKRSVQQKHDEKIQKLKLEINHIKQLRNE
ncbi:hypothetical protein PVAND_007485 [Polypedilum vanderplanki]|uniref:valine--tRNA ligase n=1 Tax=Polypedilum vanderplanki TaxID=319348 RepID=A0A9J6C6T7_POLVA|nr:hypothetical protein PVAND_007485 [Polypedilum vanderplanki]